MVPTSSILPATSLVKPSISTETVPELALIRALQCGERKAMTMVYDMYSASLYGIVFRIVKFNTESEDVLQEVFVKAWTSISLYDPDKGKLYTWLATIAKRTSLDHLKNKGTRNKKKCNEIKDLQKTIDNRVFVSNNPDVIGLKQLAMDLEFEHSSILDIVYFNGYTHVEAAEELGIPVGTLKTRLRAAITILRARFC